MIKIPIFSSLLEHIMWLGFGKLLRFLVLGISLRGGGFKYLFICFGENPSETSFEDKPGLRYLVLVYGFSRLSSGKLFSLKPTVCT